MITTEQREILKKELPFRYAKPVQDILREQEIMKPDGEDYSTTYIANIFNGENENLGIESAIWTLYFRLTEAKRSLAEKIDLVVTKEKAGA